MSFVHLALIAYKCLNRAAQVESSTSLLPGHACGGHGDLRHRDPRLRHGRPVVAGLKSLLFNGLKPPTSGSHDLQRGPNEL